MKIGFEAKRFFANYTGLGNYSRFVVDALSQSYPENQHLLFAPKVIDHAENRAILKRENVSVIAPAGLYSQPLLSAIWRTIGMSYSPAVKQLDIFHGLSQELPLGLPKNVKKVVTIHDLIFLRYPKYYNAVDVSIYKRKAQMACDKADRIIAISQQTAEDITNFLQIAPEKIEVVYQGNHSIFNTKYSSTEFQAVKQKYQLPEKFILNVGTIEERKNLLLIVKAMALLSPAVRIPLVVVGRKTPYYEDVVAAVKNANLERDVLFLSGVSFSDLPAIYQSAQLFIYPSVFEGFGIPLVEAITSGVPVITSTGSCFREAAGAGGIYVYPADAEAMAKAIAMLLTDEQKRSNLVASGRRHIQQFEPKVIATHLHEIYHSLLTNSKT